MSVDTKKQKRKEEKRVKKQASKALSTTSDLLKLKGSKEEEDEMRLKKEEKKARKAEKKAKKAETNGKENVIVEESPVEVANEANGDANGATEDSKRKKDKKRKRVEEGDDGSPKKTKVAIEAPTEDYSTYFEESRISFDPPAVSSTFTPIRKFEGLKGKVSDSLLKGVEGFTAPTPIQSITFPLLLAGHDLIGISKTGSGKTLSFSLPFVSLLSSSRSGKGKDKKPALLVLSPTRELAIQIQQNINDLLPSFAPETICIYGGVPKPPQVQALKEGKRIVVGTPGRINDLVNEGNLDLSNVCYLVVDEADRLLEKGFQVDLEKIVSHCKGKEERQTAMFSATWPMEVRRLCENFMRDGAVRVTVGVDELRANEDVQMVVHVLSDGRQKETRLVKSLQEEGFKPGKGKADKKALIFALYKKEATRLYNMLNSKGYSVGCINGDMSQDARIKSLEDFRAGRTLLLVATDVAARGLDVPNVEVVINVTFPLTIEDYIHRIGRCGRAGRKGKSVTFFTSEDSSHAGELIRVIKDAGQEPPEDLFQWGTTIKKKVHSSYGNHFRDDVKGTAKKIKFD
ncbi:DEAD-domain-containing protein [Atractiella rhizophila]|nr:DEAD-domain-containing protein [Atractiella rhizophila]